MAFLLYIPIHHIYSCETGAGFMWAYFLKYREFSQKEPVVTLQIVLKICTKNYKNISRCLLAFSKIKRLKSLEMEILGNTTGGLASTLERGWKLWNIRISDRTTRVAIRSRPLRSFRKRWRRQSSTSTGSLPCEKLLTFPLHCLQDIFGLPLCPWRLYNANVMNLINATRLSWGPWIVYSALGNVRNNNVCHFFTGTCTNPIQYLALLVLGRI